MPRDSIGMQTIATRLVGAAALLFASAACRPPDHPTPNPSQPVSPPTADPHAAATAELADARARLVDVLATGVIVRCRRDELSAEGAKLVCDQAEQRLARGGT